MNRLLLQVMEMDMDMEMNIDMDENMCFDCYEPALHEILMIVVITLAFIMANNYMAVTAHLLANYGVEGVLVFFRAPQDIRDGRVGHGRVGDGRVGDGARDVVFVWPYYIDVLFDDREW